MTKRDLDDMELDALFTAARTPVAPDPAFLDRLAEQAVVEIPRTASAPRLRLRDLLGGWQGLGGLALAGCAGLWIGLNPLSLLPDPAVYLMPETLSGTYDNMLLAEAPVWTEEEG